MLFNFLIVLFFIFVQEFLPSLSQQHHVASVLSKSEARVATPVLSIDAIFSKDHTRVDALPAERKRVLLVTGDVNPARSVNVRTAKMQNFVWPYEKTADFLKAADVTCINLETPIIKNCPLTSVGMRFCGGERNVEGLLHAGIDVVSFANNHSENYGAVGVAETREILTKNGLLVSGVNGPVYKDIRGMKFAFLAFNDFGPEKANVARANEVTIQSEITDARIQASVVVVMFHWGTEYQSQPNTRQKYLGRFAVDAGADLVVGNHPHWIQPVEIYKTKVIAYSHGNFVFDQMWSQKTREGVVGKYTFFDDRLVDVEFVPIYIENYGQPRFNSETSKKEIVLKEMKDESKKLEKTRSSL